MLVNGGFWETQGGYSLTMVPEAIAVKGLKTGFL